MDVGGFSFGAKVGVAVLTASMIGGGSAVIKNQQRLTRLETTIESLPRIEQELDEANDRLHAIERDLAVLIERFSNREAGDEQSQ